MLLRCCLLIVYVVESMVIRKLDEPGGIFWMIMVNFA